MKRIVNKEKTGENIKKLCESHGITLIDLQGIMGFKNPQSIYKWFRGAALPSVEHLFVLVNTFKKSVEEIIVFNKPDFCENIAPAMIRFVSKMQSSDCIKGTFCEVLTQLIMRK